MADKIERQDVKQILTDFLRQIADEKTEFVELPGQEDLAIVTKAEAISRYVWKCALGWKEINDKGDEVVHEPDKAAIHLLFDRLEGKITALPLAGKKLPSIADRVGEVSKRTLNNLADGG